jgi:hypothetical protein
MIRGLNRTLAVGLVVFLAGAGRDIQWHATHDTQTEFETASKQIEVHWLLWLGALMLLVVSWGALRRAETPARNPAYLMVFAGGLVYAVVSVWHFVEHANGGDPQLAHAFLYASSLLMVVGAVLGLATSRRPVVPPGRP